MNNRSSENLRPFLQKTLFFIFAAILVPAAAAGAFEPDRPVRSAAEVAYPPFSMVDADGRAYGFAVELLRASLAKMKREVSFRTSTWPEVRRWLEEGEIRALPLVGRTPEREALFDFTFPYMSLHGAIVVENQNTDIQTLSDLRGQQVAVMRGDNAEEFLQREDRGIAIQTLDTFEEALQQLSAGRHDAVVMQRLVALRLIRELGITNLKIVDRPLEGFRQDFCFAVDKGDRKMLALLNEGLALVMADGTYRHLHAKWFAALELPSHRRIVIGGDRNYPPYEFLDEQGRPRGYNVDLTRAIAEAMGLDIEIRLGPWAEIQRQAAQGRIDALQGMLYSPERDLTFDFSPPHTVSHYVAVVRANGAQPPETLAGLDGKQIVVQKRDIMHDVALEHGLSERLTAVDSQEAALAALAGGHHDAALVSRMTALYWIERHGWENLVIGRRPLLSPGYGYAVPQNQKALLAQLSEGLKVLEETGEYQRIYNAWMGVYEAPRPAAELTLVLRGIAIVLVTLLLLLLGFLLWSWSLRKKVTRRTAALQESQRQMQTLLGNLPGMAYHCRNNPSWTMEFISEGCRDLTGYRGEELTGDKKIAYQQLIHPDDRQRVWETIQDAVAQNVTFTVEYRLRSKSGALKWVWEKGRSVSESADGKRMLEGFVTDITERKQAEEAYSRLFRVAANLICVADIRTATFLQVNPAFEQVLGYTESELLSRSFLDFIHPEDVEPTQAILAEKLQQGENVVSFENRYRCKDGSYRWLEWNSHPSPEEGLTFAIAQDITERRQMEEALRKSEARYRLTTRAARIGVWEWNLITGALYMDPVLKKILGYADHEIGDHLKDWMDLIHPEDAGKVSAALQAAAQGEAPELVVEYRMIQKDGGKRWFLSRGSVLQDEAGNADRMFGTVSDVNDRKQAEKEHQKLQAQLIQAQKMESVGRLAGGIAHDYNNMLSVIIGYAELALERVPPYEPLHDDLEEILKAAHRSIGINRQLLAFARRQTIVPKVLDLNATVESMLKMLRRLIGEDIQLSWQPAADLWPVKMDPSQIDQILANLCVNARDAIADVGSITIETATTTLDGEYCEDHAGFVPGNFVTLTVSDDGCGMDKAIQDKVFEPFYTTKAVGVGTGLGLATVYGIVKQNGGFINVYSEPGKGSTFKIYLPRHTGAEDKESLTDPEALAQGHGETILVVEDEVSILKLVQRILTDLGYQVLSARSPAEALQLAEAHSGEIALLLTDVIMPEMNGRELAQRLLSLYPQLRCIYMSGYTANVIAHKGVLDAGVHFIQKPFSRKELALKILQALEVESNPGFEPR